MTLSAVFLEIGEIGRGLQAMKNFSRSLNMYCLSDTPFKNLNVKISKVYKTVSKASIKRAANG